MGAARRSSRRRETQRIMSRAGSSPLTAVHVEPPKPVGTSRRGHWGSLEPNRGHAWTPRLSGDSGSWDSGGPAAPLAHGLGAGAGRKDESVQVAVGRAGTRCGTVPKVACLLEGGYIPRGLRKLSLKKFKGWGQTTLCDLPNEGFITRSPCEVALSHRTWQM